MSIKYEIHSIKNAQGTGEERPFIRLRNMKALTADELEQKIEMACTATRGDVKAVLAELCHFAIEELSQGRRFYLPEIGYLSLSVGNTPPSEKQNGKITGKDIYMRGINFRPEKEFFTKVREGMSFEKSDYSTKSAQYTEEELWQKVGGYLSSNRYITCRIMRSEFGLSQYQAKKWLDKFATEGKLSKEGTRHQPLYFLPAAG